METRRKNLKQNNMGTPYKMKYTNGKKADPTAFPFLNNTSNEMANPKTDDAQNAIAAKIEVVNQEASEGLV